MKSSTENEGAPDSSCLLLNEDHNIMTQTENSDREVITVSIVVMACFAKSCGETVSHSSLDSGVFILLLHSIPQGQTRYVVHIPRLSCLAGGVMGSC